MNPPEKFPDNDALRQLRDELKDLNKNLKKSTKVSDRFTRVLILVALLQLVIGFFQFVSSLLNLANGWAVLGIEIVVAGTLFIAIKSMGKSLGLEK